MATFKPVGYAVIGLGGFAQNAILPGFGHSKKTKLVALVSGDRSKAQRLATKFHAGAFYTYEELPACFSNPQVEAVYIATPNGSHAHYAVQAANAAKHVLCEKPMANSVQEYHPAGVGRQRACGRNSNFRFQIPEAMRPIKSIHNRAG
jgi:predicted dehydrogenase